MLRIVKFWIKNEEWRKIFIYSTSLIVAILAYLLLTRVNDIYRFIGRIFDVLFPFILGYGIAFLLSQPVSWLENRMTGWIRKPGKRRLLATALIFLLSFYLVYLSMSVVIPSLLDSLRTFLENVTAYTNTTETWVLDLAEKIQIDPEEVRSFFNDLNLAGSMNELLSSSLSKAMTYSVTFVKTLSNLVISVAAAFYMLLYKEPLLNVWKNLVYSLISPDRANFLTLYSIDAKNVFMQYIVGNILDSIMVGVICWIGLMCLQIPYAPMIAFIVGVTNVIPVFGPFLGAIPVILLLFLIRPMYAFIFAIFILILQQVDGNILKPVILGDKLGLNGFWILFSVSVGGSLFGIPGMFLGVPVFALVYEGIQDLVEIRLKEKRLTIPEESGVILPDRS